MLNFGDVYSSIKTKLVETKNTKGIQQLGDKIKASDVLSKHFLVFKQFSEAKKSNNDKAIIVLEKYCAGEKSCAKELKSLLEFFNIDVKTIQTTPLNESINNFILYNAGQPVDLSSIKPSYTILQEWINKKVEKKQVLFSPKTLLKSKLVENILLTQELTEEEETLISVIKENNNDWVEAQHSILKYKSKNFPLKDRKMVLECVKALKTEPLFSQKVYLTQELKESVRKLFEGQFGGAGKIVLKQQKTIYPISLETDEDVNNPEFVIAKITIPIQILSKGFVEKSEEADEVTKEIKDLIRKEVFKSVRAKFSDNLDSTGIIAQTTNNKFKMVNKKTQELLVKSEIFFNCKRGEKEMSLAEYGKIMNLILTDLSNVFSKEIAQFDPEVQKQALATA